MPISFELSDEQEVLRSEIGRFGTEKVRPRARQAEEGADVPDDLRREVVELGIPTLELAPELGGAGMSLVSRVIVEEELAWGDPGIAFGVDHPGPAGRVVRHLGIEEQRERWLAGFAGEPGLRACLAWQEDDLGGELGAIETTAEETDDGWRLEGSKRFVMGAGAADRVVVLARVEPGDGPEGVRAFLVDGEAEGLWKQPPARRLGLRTVPTGDVGVMDVEVPADALLSGPDDGAGHARALERVFAELKVVAAARQVGVARAAHEHAASYAQTREAFGRKIGQFQSIAFKIAEKATAGSAARWMTWRAARALDRNRRDEGVRLAALAYVTANRAAIQGAIDCVQVLGGTGFMEDDLAEKWMRDARTIANLYGPDELQRGVAGREIEGLVEEGTS